MNRLSFVGRRLAEVALSVWVVFTLTFLYVRSIPSGEGALASDQVPATPDDPWPEQYVDWLAWLLTIWDAPVLSPIAEAFQFTLVYLGPALLFAILAGVGVRTYTVAAEGSRIERIADGVALLGVSVPIFLLAYALRLWVLPHYLSQFDTLQIYNPSLGPFAIRNLQGAVWPAAIMGVYLLAIQLHYAGEELQQYVSETFVKTARAKGAPRLRIGRHIFRNTAIPLLTVFFTDMFGMVVVGIFVVEYITHVPGLGELMITAVIGADLPLMLGLTVLAVLVGVLTNFAQDVAYLLYDPRVEFEE